MKNFKEYLLDNGTPSLKQCLKNNFFPTISYDYRLIHNYMLMQSERIINEIEYLICCYEDELDLKEV
jgi:hypothetical protein